MRKLIIALLLFCSVAAGFAANTASLLDEWKKLTEEEQWFCLLSEPLMAQNDLSIVSVNPEPYVQEGRKSVSQDILEKEWNLYSREDILMQAEDFLEGKSGHNVLYSACMEKFKATGLKTTAAIEQFAIKEGLDCRTIARHYFVAETRDVLGEYGLLAWDYGRMISVLRWGIGAGWLTEAEALEKAAPFIEKLKNSYASWEDYASHFAFGRAYYAISTGRDYNSMLDRLKECVKRYDVETLPEEENSVFTFHNIEFPAVGRRKRNMILSYKDIAYKPSKDAAFWIEAVKVENNPDTINDMNNSAVLSYLKKKKNIPAAVDYAATAQEKKESAMTYGVINSLRQPLSEADKERSKKLTGDLIERQFRIYDDANKVMQNTDRASGLYFSFSLKYALFALQTNNYERIVKVIDSIFLNLPEERYQTADYQNIVCAYTCMLAERAMEDLNFEKAHEYLEISISCLSASKNLPYWGLLSYEEMQQMQIENLLYYMLDYCETLIKRKNRQERSEKNKLNNF